MRILPSFAEGVPSNSLTFTVPTLVGENRCVSDRGCSPGGLAGPALQRSPSTSGSVAN